jgi:carbamoyltransferase
VPGGVSTGSEPKIPSGAGPSYNAAQIRTFLRSQAILVDEPGRDEAPSKAAALLAQGHRVAWLDGRLDFGAETAGSRSLLRAPSGRHPADTVAGEALAVVAERAAEIFEIDGPCSSLLEIPVRAAWRERLGITGDAARPVPVTPVPAEHRAFRTLLAHFETETGCPALVAQPLRREGGPVACAPNDAWAARDSARAAALVMGPYLIAGAPLTEDAHPRDIRVSTSTPESLE